MSQVWYLIVSIPDLCTLTYFEHTHLLFLGVNVESSKSNVESESCSINYFVQNLHVHQTQEKGLLYKMGMKY